MHHEELQAGLVQLQGQVQQVQAGQADMQAVLNAQDENILIREWNRSQPADAALQPLICTSAQVPVNVPVPDGNGQVHPQPALQHAGLGAVPQLPAGWVVSKNFILQQMAVGNVQALQLCYGHTMGINPGDPLATRRNKVGLFLFGMNMGV